MKTAKIGVLFLVGIMALAGASAGYAWWTEDLVIDGSITTGTFGAYWSLDCDVLIQDKDIATMTAELRDPEGVVGGCQECRYKTLYIDIQEAYPSLGIFFTLDWFWYGSVPGHLTEITDVADITYENGDVELDVDWSDIPWLFVMVRFYDEDGTTIDDLNLGTYEDTWMPWTDAYNLLVSTQWHQGYHLYFDVYMHFVQYDMVFVDDTYGIGTVDCSTFLTEGDDVPEGASITFDYTFHWDQYNYNGLIPANP